MDVPKAYPVPNRCEKCGLFFMPPLKSRAQSCKCLKPHGIARKYTSHFASNSEFDEIAQKQQNELASDIKAIIEQELKYASVDKWTAVEDGMPDKGDDCFVCSIKNRVQEDLFDGEWWVNQVHGDITHWMLKDDFPSPPKSI